MNFVGMAQYCGCRDSIRGLPKPGWNDHSGIVSQLPIA